MLDEDENVPIKESKIMTNSVYKNSISYNASINVTDHKDATNKPAAFEKTRISIVDLQFNVVKKANKEQQEIFIEPPRICYE